MSLICTLVLTAGFMFFLVKTDSALSVTLHAVFLLGTMVHPIYTAICTKQAESGFRAMETLVTNASVIRDGETRLVDAKQLVPGDIVILSPGEKVPADLRVVACNGLVVDNCFLTGETDSVRLNEDLSKLDAASTRNMAYSGAMVLEGTGKSIVVATGTETLFSKSALLLEQKSEISSSEISEYTSTVLSSAILCATFFFAGVYVSLEFGLRPMGMPVWLVSFAFFNLAKNLRAMISGFYFFLLNSMANKDAIVKNMETLSTLQKVD